MSEPPDRSARTWLDPEWVTFVLGFDRLAAAVGEVFDTFAWSAPPLPEHDRASPSELAYLLLGVDHLAAGARALLDRCADAAPAPVEASPPPRGDLLR